MRKFKHRSGAAQVVIVGVDQRSMGLIRECLGTEAVLPAAATASHFARPPSSFRSAISTLAPARAKHSTMP